MPTSTLIRIGSNLSKPEAKNCLKMMAKLHPLTQVLSPLKKTFSMGSLLDGRVSKSKSFGKHFIGWVTDMTRYYTTKEKKNLFLHIKALLSLCLTPCRAPRADQCWHIRHTTVRWHCVIRRGKKVQKCVRVTDRKSVRPSQAVGTRSKLEDRGQKM